MIYPCTDFSCILLKLYRTRICRISNAWNPSLGLKAKFKPTDRLMALLKNQNKKRCWPKCLMWNSYFGNCRLPTQIPPSVSIRYSIHFLPLSYVKSLASLRRRAATFQPRDGSSSAAGEVAQGCETQELVFSEIVFLYTWFAVHSDERWYLNPTKRLKTTA